MQNIKVYKLTMYGGSSLYDTNIQNLLDTIQAEIEQLCLEEQVEFEISYDVMTEEEYLALPEFDGF